MVTSQPKNEALFAYTVAMSGLRAHRAWRHYFLLRPALAFPLEKAARHAFDFVVHHARKWQDPLYAALHSDKVLQSDIPQRQPDSWSEAWWQVAYTLLMLQVLCVAVVGARRCARKLACITACVVPGLQCHMTDRVL
jgi:hypothetical protein